MAFGWHASCAGAFPFFPRDAGDVLGSQEAVDLAGDVLGGVVVAEAALLLHAPGLLVAVEVAAPQTLEAEVLEAMAHDLAGRLRYEPASPVGHADPVADLALGVGMPMLLDAPIMRPMLPTARPSPFGTTA